MERYRSVRSSFQFLKRINKLFTRERNRSDDMFSICLFKTGTERNNWVSFHLSYHFLVVPFFRMKWFYLKRSRLNAALERSTFQSNTERSGTIAFPCERGLSRSDHAEHLIISTNCWRHKPSLLPHFVRVYV